jgi:hypothetical protein
VATSGSALWGGHRAQGRPQHRSTSQSNCVTDTGFSRQYVSEICAEMKLQGSAGKARMRSPHLDKPKIPIQIAKSQDLLEEVPVSACYEKVRQRMRGLFARIGYMTVTTSNYMRLTVPMTSTLTCNATYIYNVFGSEPTSQCQAASLIKAC